MREAYDARRKEKGSIQHKKKALWFSANACLEGKAIGNGFLSHRVPGRIGGGLKSLEAFLSNVPDQMGMAFVVISHTDPERTSLLPDILRRKSAIPVIIIEEGMVPEQNTVYLPPSNRDLVFDRGKFHLKDIERKDGLHLPIDRFLESLSKAWGKRSGCAILSGTGTDGTHGLRLSKEAGG